VNLETVALHLDTSQLNSFFPLLQQGVTVPAIIGCTLKSLLCDQLAIPADYVTDRVTTIFLNNHPVDDLEHAMVHDGSRIALSAAMPGLVGATMRRGGFYAALRQGISLVAESGAAAGKHGTVRVKLFNLLLPELGPLVLARGLILEHDELSKLLQNLSGLPEESPLSAGRRLLTVHFKE